MTKQFNPKLVDALIEVENIDGWNGLSVNVYQDDESKIRQSTTLTYEEMGEMLSMKEIMKVAYYARQ